MQCPHCRREADDGAQDCPSCGFVFAKWHAAQSKAREASAAAVSVTPPFSAQIPSKTSSGTWVWLTLLALTLAVWRLEKSGGDERSGGALASEPATSLAAIGPLPDDAWRFQGKVCDLLRENPIKGVKVQFLDFQTGQNYEGVTDDDGHYSVDVPIRWKSGFAGHVSHPSYGSRFWPGSALSAPRQARLRMGLEPAPEQEETHIYRGTRKKEPVTLDFGLFPSDLSDSERQEAGQ